MRCIILNILFKNESYMAYFNIIDVFVDMGCMLARVFVCVMWVLFLFLLVIFSFADLSSGAEYSVTLEKS